MSSEWTWVALGYATAYGAVTVYLLRLRSRTARVAREERAAR